MILRFDLGMVALAAKEKVIPSEMITCFLLLLLATGRSFLRIVGDIDAFLNGKEARKTKAGGLFIFIIELEKECDEVDGSAIISSNWINGGASDWKRQCGTNCHLKSSSICIGLSVVFVMGHMKRYSLYGLSDPRMD
ncbi:hypothetical protein BCR42DRAFT_394513 [Absidia repens]|uniref:Uncharacterized protein n=1 Tax=Absidia repens TaxID=90262 RepID=A0A1X2IAD6_9FUNG|nr:hypothetical protein BCR42DRAFT_394513 [Absidia repens]